MKTKILADFQTCISVPLTLKCISYKILNLCGTNSRNCLFKKMSRKTNLFLWKSGNTLKKLIYSAFFVCTRLSQIKIMINFSLKFKERKIV